VVAIIFAERFLHLRLSEKALQKKTQLID
jgi:hypothetical protein